MTTRPAELQLHGIATIIHHHELEALFDSSRSTISQSVTAYVVIWRPCGQSARAVNTLSRNDCELQKQGTRE